jgi:hypothetical protein
VLSHFKESMTVKGTPSMVRVRRKLCIRRGFGSQLFGSQVQAAGQLPGHVTGFAAAFDARAAVGTDEQSGRHRDPCGAGQDLLAVLAVYVDGPRVILAVAGLIGVAV